MPVQETIGLKPFRVGLTLEVLAGREQEAIALASAAGSSLNGADGITHAWIDRKADEVER